jgi:hypothetical protein
MVIGASLTMRQSARIFVDLRHGFVIYARKTSVQMESDAHVPFAQFLLLMLTGVNYLVGEKIPIQCITT